MKKLFLCLIAATFLIGCKDSNVASEEEPTNEIAPASQTTEKEQNELETIKFNSQDQIPIIADLYIQNGEEPIVLLCHQAGYSRGEYRETAPKLNEMGFSCMAIDQRSGKEVNNVVNETAKFADSAGAKTGYLDARQDIEAAIDYLYKRNGGQPLILVGSSYSASLALMIGKENDKVKAVASFSPGEYFDNMNISEQIEGFDKPLFVTSAKSELKAAIEITGKVRKEVLSLYKPEEKGIHGSRALWEKTKGHEGYWTAFSAFLNGL